MKTVIIHLGKYLTPLLICINLLATINSNILVNHVKKAISNAENNISQLNKEVLDIQGLSGHKVKHFLNNLCTLKGGRYLEIGVWQGGTFVSALYNNQNNLSEAIAIDNWIMRTPYNSFEKNTNNFLQPNSFKFYESDCFKINLTEVFKNKINIYFYDGEHNFDDHVSAFTYFDSILDDNFIAIVDDYNWDAVQKGTQKAFKDLNYNVIYELYIPATYTTWFEELGWWNGIYIAVVSKNSKV